MVVQRRRLRLYWLLWMISAVMVMYEQSQDRYVMQCIVLKPILVDRILAHQSKY